MDIHINDTQDIKNPIDKYKRLYYSKLRNIKLLSDGNNVKWNLKPTTLTCCIVEPRIMDELKGVLYNIANIYGQCDVGLTIYHGTNNHAFINEIIKTWENVVLYNLNVSNLTVDDYSNLLTQKGFYQKFTSSHVLIFQSDTYIFKPIPSIYYTFDYVGAPWKNTNNNNKKKGKKFWGNGCGNGGISLRNVDTMIRVTTDKGEDKLPEDIYFSNQQLNVCTSNHTLHTEFSTEQIFNINSYCCHKPYYSMYNKDDTCQYISFLNNIV